MGRKPVFKGLGKHAWVAIEMKRGNKEIGENSSRNKKRNL